MLITIDYNGFTEIEGYEFPYEITYTRAGLQLTYTVSLVTINSKLNKDTFTLKELKTND